MTAGPQTLYCSLALLYSLDLPYCPPSPLLPEPEHSPAAGHQPLIMSLQLLRKHRESAGVRGRQAGIRLSTVCCENAPEEGHRCGAGLRMAFQSPDIHRDTPTNPYPEGSWSLDAGCREGKVGQPRGEKVGDQGH